MAALLACRCMTLAARRAAPLLLVPAAARVAPTVASAAAASVLRRLPTIRAMSGGPSLSDAEKEAKILNILRCFDRIDASKVRPLGSVLPLSLRGGARARTRTLVVP